MILKLLSPEGLTAVHERITDLPAQQRTPLVRAFNDQFDRYAQTIAPAIAFLQGRDATLMHRIASRSFLPEGSRFESQIGRAHV